MAGATHTFLQVSGLHAPREALDNRFRSVHLAALRRPGGRRPTSRSPAAGRLTRVTRRPVLTSRPGRAFAGTATVASALILSGCAGLSQQATFLEYDAADGVSAQVGSVQLTDVLLVSSGQGGAARLLGTAYNPGSTPVQIAVAPAGASSPSNINVTVPPGNTVRFDGQPSGNNTATAAPVSLPSITAAPGRTTPVTFTSSSAGTVSVSVPVLLNQYPYGTASVTHAPAATPTAEGAEGGEG